MSLYLSTRPLPIVIESQLLLEAGEQKNHRKADFVFEILPYAGEVPEGRWGLFAIPALDLLKTPSRSP